MAAQTPSPMTIQVTGLDHIFVTVSDLRRSEVFYDGVMKVLGFRKGTNAIDGVHCIHYFNPQFQYTLRPSRQQAGMHDPEAPGLNHFCFQVAKAEDVDLAAQGLRALNISVTKPCCHPEYAPDYYAIYFTDPDGIRLEIVNRIHLRDIIRDRWSELEVFQNPLQKLGALENGADGVR
jgi:glyoxylase I family protein